MDDDGEVVRFRGKLLEAMTREELIAAVKLLGKLYREQNQQHLHQLEMLGNR